MIGANIFINNYFFYQSIYAELSFSFLLLVILKFCYTFTFISFILISPVMYYMDLLEENEV